MKLTSTLPWICGAAMLGCLGLPASGQELQLLAYWNFDDTKDATKTLDSVGGVVAEIVDAKYGPGRTGKAGDSSLDVNVDQSNSCHAAVDASFANKASANDVLAVSFWQKNTSDVRNQSAFWITGEGQDRAFQAHTPWSGRTMYFDTGGGCCNGDQRINGDISDAVDLDAWSHWVFIKNKANKQVWINGNLELEGVNSNELPTTLDQLVIGNASDKTHSVPGLIDEFAVWGSALTPAQIKTLAGGATPPELLDNSDPGIELSKTIDFGFRPSASPTHALSVIIKNTGKTKPLLITSVKVLSGDAANFTVASFPSSIAVGQTGEVKINFDSKGVFKSYSAVLETVSNDTDADDKTILSTMSLGFVADADGDGLTDAAEVNTHKTDPLKADTDSDGLTDSEEINTYKTDATKADTDGDGSGDLVEALFGGNPTDSNVKMGTWLVRTVSGKDVQFGDMETFKAALDDPTQIASEKVANYPVINFRDNAQGHFATNELPFPLWDAPGDRDDFGIYVTGKFKVSKAGKYTFGCNSDDGFQLNIDGKLAVEFPAPRGSADTLGAVDLTAGEHTLEFWFYERGGGAQVELFVNTQLGEVDSFGAGKFILLPAFGEGKADADNDGLNDFWEKNYFKNLTETGAGDPDKDTLTNLQEQAAGTDPTKTDSDGDTLNDAEELNGSPKSSPILADTDGDGLNDRAEKTRGTNPNNRDTDGDGINDSVEVAKGSNPLDANSPGAADPFGRYVAFSFDKAAAGDVITSELGGLKGTLIGGAALSADAGGRSGQAGDRALSISDAQSVQVTDVTKLNEIFTNDVITVAFWQKLNAVKAQTTFKAQSTSSSGGERGFSVHTTWSDRTVYYDTAGCCAANTQRINKNVGGLNLLQWHHFAFVKDGKSKRIYIDGELFHSGEGADPLPSDLTAFWIGSAIDSTESMNGFLDDFAIFTRALDESTLKQLAGGTSPAALTAAKPSPNLIGYWPADEGTGTIVGNPVNGALEGTLNKGTWSKTGEGHSGKAGDYAFDVDGNDQGTSHVTTPTMGKTFKEITITAWVKGKATGAWTGLVGSRDTPAIGMGFRDSSGELTYTWNDNNQNSWGFVSELVVPEDQWAFVAVTVKPEAARLHVGTTGAGASFKTAVNDIPQLTQANLGTGWHFGRDNCCGTARNFDGLMDDISIWDSALTDDELKSLWNGSKTPLNVRQASASTGGGDTAPKPAISFLRSATGQGISFAGATGKSYDVEYSEDLKTWTAVSTGVSGAVNYQDTDATRRGKRIGFYRARQK